jgi:cytochrome c oxidase subunit II
VRLAGGTTELADENYIRHKLFDPRATTVEGYDKNVMPDFSHQLSEEDVLQLIAYIKSIGPRPGSTLPSSTGETPSSYGNQPGIAYPGAPPIENQTPGIR